MNSPSKKRKKNKEVEALEKPLTKQFPHSYKRRLELINFDYDF